MQALLNMAAGNTLCAAVLALAALAASLLIRRPALSHALWLLVLVKLVTPPIWWIGIHVSSSPPPAPTRHTEVADADPVLFASDTALLVPSKVLPISSPVSHHFIIRDRVPAGLCLIWLIGSISCAWVAIVRLRRFGRVLRFVVSAPPEVAARADRLAQQLALRGAPDVSFVPAAVSPMLIGTFSKPHLLIPSRLWEDLNPRQRDALVLHELAHFRRRDHWVRCIELLVTVIYWWNPLTWLARRQLRIHEEICCDAWVTWAMPGEADEYAAALVEAIEFVSLSRPALPALASGVGEFKHLQRRLLMIRSGKQNRKLGWTGFLASAAVLGIPLSLTLAQQKPAPQESKTSLPVTQPQDASAANHSVEERLNQTLPDQSFEDVGLDDVIEYMRVVMGANFNANWKFLEAAGFHRDAHVVLKLTRPKAADGLQKILDAASEPNHKLTYVVRDGVIDIVPAGGKSGATASLTARARLLTEQAKYDEALALVKKILELDSTDEYAIGVQPLLEDKVQLAQQRADRKVLPYLATPKDRALDKHLDRAMPEVHFDGVALSDVIDFLRDVSGDNIVVNWKSLEAAGVEHTAPVTVQVRNVTFAKALSLVLENAAVDPEKLTYKVDQGVISIFAPIGAPAKKVVEQAAIDPKVQAKLDRIIPQVNFNMMRLTDAVAFLRDATGADIFVDWRALREVGIEQSTPVTLRLQSAKLSKVLELVLNSAAGPDIRLAYSVDGTVIAITTNSHLIKNTLTRVYDVRDLLGAAKGKARQRAVDHLIKSIIDTVDTGSWRDTGGNYGALRELQGQIIITQTADNQQQIVDLLEKLRAAHKAESEKR